MQLKANKTDSIDKKLKNCVCSFDSVEIIIDQTVRHWSSENLRKMRNREMRKMVK